MDDPRSEAGSLLPDSGGSSSEPDLRVENELLRARLKQAADALHAMQAELRKRAEEGKSLRDTAEQLAFDRESLERRLRRQSEASRVEIDRLVEGRRRLETDLQSAQSAARDKAQQLLKERMVDQQESAATRQRLERELEEKRRELSATQEQLQILVVGAQTTKEVVAVSAATRSRGQGASAERAPVRSARRDGRGGFGHRSTRFDSPPMAPPERTAAAAPTPPVRESPAEQLGAEDFADALERGVRLVTTDSFRRHEPVSRRDIRVSEWLRQADTLIGLERLASNAMSRDELQGVVYRFYQRGWVHVR